MNDHDEEKHLEEEHGLVKKTVFVREDQKRKSQNAERVARHRQKKKEQGLVLVEVSQLAAEAFKEAGSFEEWYKKHWIQSDLLIRYRTSLKFVEKFPRFIQKWIFKKFH